MTEDMARNRSRWEVEKTIKVRIIRWLMVYLADGAWRIRGEALLERLFEQRRVEVVCVQLVPVFPRPPYDVLLHLKVILLKRLLGLQQMELTSTLSGA